MEQISRNHQSIGGSPATSEAQHAEAHNHQPKNQADPRSSSGAPRSRPARPRDPPARPRPARVRRRPVSPHRLLRFPALIRSPIHRLTRAGATVPCDENVIWSPYQLRFLPTSFHYFFFNSIFFLSNSFQFFFFSF